MLDCAAFGEVDEGDVGPAAWFEDADAVREAGCGGTAPGTDTLRISSRDIRPPVGCWSSGSLVDGRAIPRRSDGFGCLSPF